MRTVLIPGTDLHVSTFCMGAMPFGDSYGGDEGDALLDTFVEHGGNFFDTAHCYCFWTAAGAGSSERALADYLDRRGLWDEVTVATKGGHPSESGYRTVEHYLSPGRIAADIDDSLGRMQIDTIDLYWLHRDDLRVPVGEIVECLNSEVRGGRIRYFAGSNWSGTRLEQANTYALENGLQGFVASQPCWSLASKPMSRSMRELSPEDWEYHVRMGMPVIPYSPTAQGYFASGGAKGKAYDVPANAARLRKVQALAEERGVSTNQVALAWLLNQPFPVIPILGTSKCEHLLDALGAANISIDPTDLVV
ncbi:MAG: aldo/keto reductase [Lentisphaerae bacterium]|jgi:aryl-alcohol dehydrogenase-like predicted oxidoreductase|nr:aldo/keto reductase [Lentisphaerota bacterium]MBT4815634.1 aldo/keto reductase [Lentisphaerota bacterium]MBT5612518.1 aldo/keto reductase [Lentisphaerota bacterium]MBT7061313.1 aldo/keto reductase [Lentisphaerota bacterium]MBT7840454.1 aldo/keto reductase [Lentisphaerota bacterium]